MTGDVTRRRVLFAGAGVALAGGLASCAGPMAPALSASDQAAVDRVQAWLDHAHGFQARFLQFWPDGAMSEGIAKFDPPGRLRLDYLPQGGMTMIANAGHVVVTDPRTGSVTRMPTSASPLGLLLDGHIRLGGDIRVTDVQTPAGSLQVSLARDSNQAAGLLTLTFDDPPDGVLRLSRIEAVDAEHRRTRFRLTQEVVGRTFPEGTFN